MIENSEWVEVRPLIFERLSVTWSDITLTQPHRVPPIEAWCRTLGIGKWSLRSFPVPGCPNPPNLTEVEIRPEGLAFPSYGFYTLIGPFGAAKILLIDPQTNFDEHITALTAFVSACSWHSAADTHLAYQPSQPYPLYPSTLMRKLFYSDQPLALWCGQISDMLAMLMHLSGIQCRKVCLNNPNEVGHIFIEAYFPIMRKWAIVDPDFGVVLRHNEFLLSAAEVIELRAAGRAKEIQVIDLVGKPFPRPDRNFPMWFSGQVTWQPEDTNNVRNSDVSYYHDVVIERGFISVQYFKYSFNSTVMCQIIPTIGHGLPLTLAEIDALLAADSTQSPL